MSSQSITISSNTRYDEHKKDQKKEKKDLSSYKLLRQKLPREEIVL